MRLLIGTSKLIDDRFLMDNMGAALSLNAFFSIISGIILILFPRFLARVFAVKMVFPFWIIGIFLLVFSLTVIYQIKRQSPSAILWIIIQDLIWVVASIYILTFHPFAISRYGNLTIASVAFAVFLVSLNQSLALAKLDADKVTRIKRLTFKKVVEASKVDTWEVISDVGNFHKVASNLVEVTIISGQGQGMARSCSDGKNTWTETCSVWQVEKEYSFLVNTSDPHYPLPLSYFKGTWQIEEIDQAHTKIMMTFEFQYKRRIYNLILHPLIRGRSKKIGEAILNNWQSILENKNRQGTDPSPLP